MSGPTKRKVMPFEHFNELEQAAICLTAMVARQGGKVIISNKELNPDIGDKIVDIFYMKKRRGFDRTCRTTNTTGRGFEIFSSPSRPNTNGGLNMKGDNYYRIDAGVPIPPVSKNAFGKRGPQKYGFGRLEVGNSIFVSDPVQRQRARSAAFTWARDTGKQIATRNVGQGIRIWRTA